MYYLLINGQRTGPYQSQDIQRMLSQNAIGYETQFWKDGMFSWETVGSQRHLFETPVYQQPPPQQMYQQPPVYHQPQYQQPMYQQPPQVNIYNQQPMMQQQFSSKSRVAYILLGLFLGGLGIHNFYAGYAGRGAVQLILNLTLFWTMIVPVIVGIWVLVEVCTVDRDSFGHRLS